jgi:DNA (cytosine-5)-methyltransferase 1
MIKIGSLFAGIGGFELGLERAIPGAKTIWQVEQNPFCQRVLSKHWPDAKIYNDVRNITKDNVEPIDILCGGFPCQDISLAGKGEGLDGKKSGLWWEMLRIISELSQGRKKPIVVLENVAAISFRGGCEIVGSLAEIGYCCEWRIISAREFGAPHLRRRWFAVAYSDSASCKGGGISVGVQQKDTDSDLSFSKERYWKKTSPVSAICGVDDGIPDRLDRLRALGNAIVPQCSEWIGQQIVKSGLLDGLS